MDPDPYPYWPPSGSGSVKNEYGSETLVITVRSSVGDPDPHVFGPPGSGRGMDLDEVWIRIRLRIWILPFFHKDYEQTEIMLANFKF